MAHVMGATELPMGLGVGAVGVVDVLVGTIEMVPPDLGGCPCGAHGLVAVDVVPGGQGGKHCPVNGSFTVPGAHGPD
jgi:hypothetical protein